MSHGNVGLLETTLSSKKSVGKKLLVPYVTGGLDDWINVVYAVIDAGADAVEIGIPFSDPMMDGPTIQVASQRALDGGATPLGILSEIQRAHFEVPIAIMTYYNLIYHAGHERMANILRECGVSGSIIPDLQVDEAHDWMYATIENEIDNILLVAPSTTDDRLVKMVELSRGFIYGAGLMGVTGERESLATSASDIAKRIKAKTDKPVLIGVGISTADQATSVSTVADGVIVGSALVRRILEGEGPKGAFDFISEIRQGLDTLGA